MGRQILRQGYQPGRQMSGAGVKLSQRRRVRRPRHPAPLASPGREAYKTPFMTLKASFAALSGPGRAGCWISASAFCYIGMIAIVREMAPEIHIFEIVFFRSLFAAMFMIPWLMRHGIGALRTPMAGLLALRGAGAFIAGSCMFYAATLLPLGEFMAITFMRPILASIGAIVFLGEIARGRRWTAILVGFAGAMIVVRPGFQVLNVGALFVLAAVTVQVSNTLIIKYATRTVHPDAIATWHALVVAPLALVPTLFVWTTPTLEQFSWLVVAGFASILVQRSMARAFAATDATVVLAFGFVRLPVAALAGFVFFSEVPGPWVWTGGAVIIAASLALAKREDAAERSAA